MSKFYGTMRGNRGSVTRTGSRDITCALQSWKGSLITRLYYDENDNLCVRLCYGEGSTTIGDVIFNGQLNKLVETLKKIDY